MTGSGAGDTGSGPPAIDAFERIADAQREMRSSGADKPFDGNPGNDAGLNSAIAQIERLVDALAGLVVASPDAPGEGPLDQMVVAFEFAEIEAQASVLLTDLWNTADGALRLVESEIAQIGGADVAPQLSDWARRLRHVGRSAEDVAAAFSRFILDQATVASTAPLASELDEPSDSGHGSSGQAQPPRAGATAFVASLLDLVARIAGVARSVTASRAVAAPTGPAPRVVFLPPLLNVPLDSKVRGDVAELGDREPASAPVVRRGSFAFDRRESGQVPRWLNRGNEQPGPGGRTRKIALVAVAIVALGATATIGAQLLGGGGWQRLLGAVGFPSTTPGAVEEPNGSPPGASGSVAPVDGSAVPGSEAPGTTGGPTNAPGGPTPGPGQTPNPTSGPTPGPTSTPGPSGSPSPTPGPSGSPPPSATPGPTGPPPTPGPSPTPTPTPAPTLDPAAAAQQFADRVSTAAASVDALLDAISAALAVFDYPTIIARAGDLADLADAETLWLQSHPPALCYEPEYSDALAAYADLRSRADAIIALANAQDPSGIPYQVAKGRQAHNALNQAANQAPGGC